MDTNNNDSDSLEEKTKTPVQSGTGPAVIETDSLETPSDGSAPAPEQKAAAPKSRGAKGVFKKFTRKFNIYMLIFILVLVISGGILAITAFSQNTAKDPTIASQSVSADTLKQLAKSDATVGDPKQILNVQSNAVFAGKVLIRDSLDVAGTIHVNGALTLPGITVSGESNFDQVQVNKTVNIGGDATILGQLSIKKNLNVSGNATFGGPVTAPQITTSQFQLLGDFTFTSHIVAGGGTPGRSNGGALGSGGTSSVSGSDTGGSININTGSSAPVGCFVTVNFTNRFNNTPHVVITPVGSGAAGLDYYISRSTTSFTVCTASDPPDNSSFSFDYIVLG
jgi:cytoskeletal protein CcmA (bactofilin family)